MNIMSAVEWPSLDGHNVPLPTIVSSSDLFDGELFGDELIDIYDGSVDNDGMEHDIPLLSNHPGADVRRSVDDPTDVLGALDEGFVGFHHSNSFNDLTNLLSPMAGETNDGMPTSTLPMLVAKEPEPAATVAVQVTMTVPSSQNYPPAVVFLDQPASSSGKKRTAAGAPTSSNAPKKKSSSPRRASGTKKTTAVKAAVTATVQPITEAPKKGPESSNDTPNPLSMESSVVPAAPKATSRVVISKKGGVSHNVKPVVVESRCGQSAVGAAAKADAPKSTVSPATSHSDFKDLAQAAISELITSAGTVSCDDGSSDENFSFKVDTSTSHIKALTGNNWVAACAGASLGAIGSVTTSVPIDNSDNKSTDSGDGNSGSNNRCKRQNLTADERARQNRDRNREHARNTRLRKKAYVEELKHTLTELVSQRDAAELEKRQIAQRDLEQREVRFRVIEEFLKLRGRNETNYTRWAAILEDDFAFTVPTVDMKNYHNGIQSPITEKVLTGVSNIMADSADFHSFLQSGSSGHITFQYNCDRKDFFMDGSNAVMNWTGNSMDSAGQPESSGVTLKGVVRAKFSPASNKLLSLELSFDSGVILIHRLKVNRNTVHNPICDSGYDIVAAEAAASQADAILDSLQMPCLSSHVPHAVNVVHNSSSSESSSKGELDSDESFSEPNVKAR